MKIRPPVKLTARTVRSCPFEKQSIPSLVLSTLALCFCSHKLYWLGRHCKNWKTGWQSQICEIWSEGRENSLEFGFQLFEMLRMNLIIDIEKENDSIHPIDNVPVTSARIISSNDVYFRSLSLLVKNLYQNYVDENFDVQLKRSNLDMNHHVNNTTYTRWMLTLKSEQELLKF